jgi:ribonuclease HI
MGKFKINGFRYICYFDGSCGPKSPGGDMGSGSVVIDNKTGEILFEASRFYSREEFERTTCNVAEYLGLIQVLEYLNGMNLTNERVAIIGDSKLVINQMADYWGVKDGAYKFYYIVAMGLHKKLHKTFSGYLKYRWVPREENAYADKLSKINRDEKDPH